MEQKKRNHQANVVRITSILPHNNADTLELIPIGEYQAVSKKGTFTVGDLGVYLQPDSVVPQTEAFRFIWEPYFCEPVANLSPAEATDYVVPDKRRRITAKKLRGEWSEGLLMPLSDFTVLFHESVPAEGQDVSDLIGITHYDPDRGVESTKGDNAAAPRRKYPKTLKGWFFFALHKLGFRTRAFTEAVGFSMPEYDVDALKNFRNVLIEGERVIATEKIHGSNARYVFIDGKMYAGSRTQWKHPKSNCVWRKALAQNSWIEDWCRAHPEHTLYGEVVPTQKGYDYGCEPGEAKLYVFDVRKPDGTWMDWQEFDTEVWPGTRVPLLYEGPYANEVLKLADGRTATSGKHVREGIVIKPVVGRSHRGLGRVILKLVSNVFLEKDSK